MKTTGTGRAAGGEQKHSLREPLIHLTKRSDMQLWKRMLIRVCAGVAGFLLCTLLAYFLIGAQPGSFIQTFFEGSFGHSRRLWKLFKDSAVLLCIALAITPAFKMRFWNIGAEGQVLVSALASVAVVYYSGNAFPEWLLLLLMLAAALAAGMIWAVIPAIFKALWNANETLFTLMMNYVATYFVAFALIKWTPDGSSVLGELPRGYLPKIYNEYLLLIIVVLLTTAFVFAYQNYSKHGYEIAVVGESQRTACYIGINVKKVIIRTMALSGLLCGLAGFLIVAALDHSVTSNSVGGNGFTAIIVSWLAQFNPLLMLFTALLITFLNQGADRIATIFNVSGAFPNVVVGIMIFFIIGCEFFVRYKVHFRKRHKVQAVSAATADETAATAETGPASETAPTAEAEAKGGADK